MLVILTSPQQQFVGNPFSEAVLLQEAGSQRWQGATFRGDALYFLLATITGVLALTAPPLAMPFEALATAGFLLLSLFSRHFVTFFAAVAVPPACRALAAPLREGMEETLTVVKLALPALLRQSLATTNAIENLNGTIRRVSRNVKHWKSPSMVRRWTALGVVTAQKKFRRI